LSFGETRKNSIPVRYIDLQCEGEPKVRRRRHIVYLSFLRRAHYLYDFYPL